MSSLDAFHHLTSATVFGSPRSSSVVSASAQPRSLASAAPASDVLALATTADAQLVSADGTQLVSSLPLPSSCGSPTCIAVSPSGNLAVVGTDDSKVFLFEIATNSKKNELRHSIELRAQPTALAFPPEEGGAGVVAIGLATGKVPLYSVESGEIVNARCVCSGVSRPFRVTCLLTTGN